MSFSKTAEYALRAMVALARERRCVTAEELACLTRVPKPYLAKILRQLTQSGLVTAVRGKRGGCRLSAAGLEATVYAVVQAVDPVCRIRACPLGVPEHRDHLCPMHATLDAAFAATEASFKYARLVELVDASPDVESIFARAVVPMPCSARRGRTGVPPVGGVAPRACLPPPAGGFGF